MQAPGDKPLDNVQIRTQAQVIFSAS